MNARPTLTPEVQHVALDKLTPSTTAVQTLRRGRFDAASIQELADSYRDVGLLEPLLVRRPRPDAPDLEIVAGERRWLAARIASMETVPVIVRDLTDGQVLRIQMAENLQRDNFLPLEEGVGFRELMTAEHIDAETLGASIGKSRSYVYSRTKLIDLAEPVRAQLAAGTLDASKALLLARLPAKLQAKGARVLENYGYMPYKRFAEKVRDQLMVPLASAPFSLEDGTLHRFEKIPGSRGAADCIGLPACVDCPFNSRNDRELQATFGADAHICTDRPCFEAKTTEHTKRRRADLIRTGRPIVTGDAAEAIAPRKDVLVGFVDLDEPCDADEFPEREPDPAADDPDGESPAYDAAMTAWDERYRAWSPRTYRQLVGEADHAPQLLEDPHDKRIRELIPVTEARKLLKAQNIDLPGYVGQKPRAADAPYDPAKAEAERRREREAVERETAFRARVLAEIHAKWTGPLKREHLVEIAEDLVGHSSKEVLKGLYGGKVPVPGQLKDNELARFIIVGRLADVVRTHWNSPAPLLAAAKKLKIDPAKIKAQMAAEAKGKAAPAKKKPAAKKKAPKK
jgi:ParB/RepB/Spo0J family partition protein